MTKYDASLLIKRILDILGSVMALFILIGPLLIIAILIRLELGRPVIFKQLRPGKNGKIFFLNKFRTMRELRDNNGLLLPDKDRLTALGKALRKWSLDELPELWNVVRGEMSLVGPRPLLLEYLDRYDLEQARRHEVKPGITGWAQVNGRNATSWEDRFKLDIWYLNHVTMWLDLKILALTVWKVIKREGINQPGHSTMKEFMGVGHQK